MAIFPEVRWAQRSNATVPEKNIVYLTVAVHNLTDEKVELTETKLSFQGKDEANSYDLTIEFYEEIDPALSKQITTGQGHTFVLRKKKAQEEYWPRLTKDKARKPYIKTDFDKWVDEDEQEEHNENDMDMGDMGGMGGMPGMGGFGGPGAGGPGGFDMSSLLGGAGGAGGEGLDMSKLQELSKQFGASDLDGNDEVTSDLGEAQEKEEPEEAEDSKA